MIEAVGLTKRRDGRALLDGVSLRVGAREAVAVMGASGAGKTTLLRCLDGLERADAQRDSIQERAPTELLREAGDLDHVRPGP